MAFAAHPGFVRIRPRTSAVPALSRIEWGLWILSLALVARLTLLARRRSLDEFAVVDQLAIVQIVIVIASFGIVLLSSRAGELFRRVARGASGLVLVYYLFGALSSAWSPQPAFSLYRAAEVISQIAIIHLALLYAPGFVAAERRAIVAILASMVLGMLSVVATLGMELRFDFWHTNQYSVPAMIAFVYCSGELLSGRRPGRQFLYLGAGAGLVGMMAGTSSASLISALVGVGVAAMLSRHHQRQLFLIAMLVGIFLVLGGADVIKHLIFYGKSEAGIERLSGRAYFWQGYIKEFADSPLIGHGFAVSARISTYWRTTNTHNSILSVLLGTGLVGMAIVVRATLCWGWDALRVARRGQKGSIGCTAAICAGLVNSLSVAFLGETWMMSTYSFICVLALFSLYVGTDPIRRERQRLVLRRVR